MPAYERINGMHRLVSQEDIEPKDIKLKRTSWPIHMSLIVLIAFVFSTCRFLTPINVAHLYRRSRIITGTWA
jgi:hypothetical protein